MIQGRPMRADAARNRAKILEAADGQIVVHGPQVPMEVIAEAAGVAVGTLYRHFPTKNDLVRAVIESHLEFIATEAEAAAALVAAGACAYDEFARFARRLAAKAVDDKAVKAAAGILGADYDPGDCLDRAAAAIERILTAAKADGDLRADLTTADLYLLVKTVPTEMPAPARDRWLDIMLDGVRGECRTGTTPDLP